MKAKNSFMFLLVILTGAIVGSLIAQLVSGIPFLSWLAYGDAFGISVNEPLTLDLAVLQLKFGCVFKINLATVLGIVIAMILYKKLM